MAEGYTSARDASRASGGGWPQPAQTSADGWGPSTATYSGGSRYGSAAGSAAPLPDSRPRTTVHRPQSAEGARGTEDGWTPAGPASREQQRANKLMERQLREMRNVNAPRERGVRWWVALLVLIAIAVVGGLIDTIGTSAARGGFNIGIVVASIVAILLVKRSHMFPIVIAPPIVYSVAAVFQLYLRSSGLHDKKVVLDAAANYLVYGFPAIATATAAVLIIAGARMIVRK